tara:strand:- start:4470 stop:5315 length:846 start_codon:yes stop_codon:yes gene_type:complete
MDKAFTAMLVPGDKTAEQVFAEEWSFEKILTGNEKFTKADLDPDLLPARDPGMPVSENYLTFLSLKAKGLIMLKALREKLLPQIESVLGTQVPIVLQNQDGEGDQFIGFIDFVIKLKGYDKPIIGDLKTSSVKYEADSVKKSMQLSVYTYEAGTKYGTNLAGFFVISKKLTKTRHQTCLKCGHEEINSRAKTCTKELPKRCGGAWDVRLTFNSDLTIIIDSIDTEQEDQVLNEIDTAHSNIKNGIFEQNFNSCINKYHKKCVYYELCRTGSMTGLVIKDPK